MRSWRLFSGMKVHCDVLLFFDKQLLKLVASSIINNSSRLATSRAMTCNGVASVVVTSAITGVLEVFLLESGAKCGLALYGVYN